MMFYFADLPKVHTITLGGGTFLGDNTKNTTAVEPYNYSNKLTMKSNDWEPILTRRYAVFVQIRDIDE